MATTGNSILIIGYGEMGHAMEHLLGARHRLSFWDIRPVEGHPAVALEAAASGADFVIYCVPVTPLGELAARVLPVLPEQCISLSVAKGLDAQARPAAQILAEVYGDARRFGVVYGPMIAEEIRAGRPSFAQVGVSQPDSYAALAGLFAGSGLALEYSADITGISWASVLKNVYAMLFGAADELQLGDNVRGFLAVAALREMQAIVAGKGGVAATAQQLAGLGDLITTATSTGSHHRALGSRLAHGDCGRLAGEGIHTLAMIEQYNLVEVEKFPLFRLVQTLVDAPGDPCEQILDGLAALHPQH
jgi:glycerol-3-phosphate dehydrogenase (NAD(P)+)